MLDGGWACFFEASRQGPERQGELKVHLFASVVQGLPADEISGHALCSVPLPRRMVRPTVTCAAAARRAVRVFARHAVHPRKVSSGARPPCPAASPIGSSTAVEHTDRERLQQRSRNVHVSAGARAPARVCPCRALRILDRPVPRVGARRRRHRRRDDGGRSVDTRERLARMRQPTVVVMAKSPVAGRVKTRCCPPCTPTQAAELAAAALADTLDAVAGCAAPRAASSRSTAGRDPGFLPASRHRATRRTVSATRIDHVLAEVGPPVAADRDGHAAGDISGPRPRAASW